MSQKSIMLARVLSPSPWGHCAHCGGEMFVTDARDGGSEQWIVATLRIECIECASWSEIQLDAFDVEAMEGLNRPL
jgi:hypothetical protein